MPNHETVSIMFEDEYVDIDAQIVPLVRAFWEQNIPTIFSCQGDPNEDLTSDSRDELAYVMIPRDTNTKDFVEYLFSEYPDFVNDTPTLFTLNITNHPFTGESRYTIRFQHKDIQQFADFVMAYAEQ